MRLNPEELRRYARRDWSAPERLSRRDRAAQPMSQKIALAVTLYEAARSANPHWPTKANRVRDLESHIALRKRLLRAVNVGSR